MSTYWSDCSSRTTTWSCYLPPSITARVYLNLWLISKYIKSGVTNRELHNQFIALLDDVAVGGLVTCGESGQQQLPGHIWVTLASIWYKSLSHAPKREVCTKYYKDSDSTTSKTMLHTCSKCYINLNSDHKKYKPCKSQTRDNNPSWSQNSGK